MTACNLEHRTNLLKVQATTASYFTLYSRLSRSSQEYSYSRVEPRVQQEEEQDALSSLLGFIVPRPPASAGPSRETGGK
eukprot:scaffold103291_cov37-Tisochrysis_lutea.AAC.3